MSHEIEYEGGGRGSTYLEEQSILGLAYRTALVKLGANRDKPHWRTPGVKIAYLIDRLRQEVDELEQAVADPAKGWWEVWDEVGDVVNFAAMVGDLFERGHFRSE